MKPLYNKINEKLFVNAEDISSEIDLIPIKRWLQETFSISKDMFILYYENGNYILNVNDNLLKEMEGNYIQILSLPPENLIIKSDHKFGSILIDIKLNKKICNIINNVLCNINFMYVYIRKGGDIYLDINCDYIYFVIENNDLINIKKLSQQKAKISFRFKNNSFNRNIIKGLKNILQNKITIDIEYPGSIVYDLEKNVNAENNTIIAKKIKQDKNVFLFYLGSDIDNFINNLLPEIRNIDNCDIFLILQTKWSYPLISTIDGENKIYLDKNITFHKYSGKWCLKIITY